MKKIVMIFLIFILGISGILGFNYINNNNFKLKRLGYSSSEINVITTTLNKNNIDYILSNEYNQYLVKIIEDDSFNEEAFESYINYYEKYNFLDSKDVVMIVNYDADKIDYNDILILLISNNNFKAENLERYVNYYENNPNISENSVISIVNNNVDNFIDEYNDFILDLIDGDYFIVENVKRYLDYYNKVDNISSKDVISAVNSNIDYDFYTNIKDVDISKGNLVLVNKYYILDKNFVPDNLVNIDPKYGHPYQLKSDVYEQYKKMCEDAILENLYLFATSPYRSYSTQASLYANYTNTRGKQAADTFSARAGHSEHQTGLAIDIVSKNSNFNSFDETMEFSWMKENAHKYGFILRYPKGKEYLTGYMYEPWHYRYVGEEVATKIVELDITYEEYYAYYVK
jgi:D-alanyl-D-alanine carboxypeptidase